MSANVTRTATASALREAFDQSFAEAPPTTPTLFENFLTVRVASHPYAIRLSEISGLHRDRKVVPVISSAPQFLGIVGLRGTMAPVYDLAALLGHAAGQTSRWLILTHAPSPVGFAFDLYEGHVRMPQGSVHSPGEGDPARRHVRDALRVDAVIRPVIHIASVVEALSRQVAPENQSKER